MTLARPRLWTIKTHVWGLISVEKCFMWRIAEIRRGADKSLAFLISPTGGLQHN
jgi:hypothetical protein